MIKLLLAVACILFSNHSFSQISLVDDLQRKMILASPANRIVSLAPSITESLFAIGADNQIVGVTDYCNYPPKAKTKQRVGGVINPNIETIVSLKPDLIVLSMEGNVRNDFDKLTSFGVPVFVTNPRNLQGIYKSIAQLGELSGRKQRAAALAGSMKLRVDSLRRNVGTPKKHTVLFFVSLQPIIVIGRNTFLGELIELAGGTNTVVKVASTYPTYSREAVLKDNPDVLIFMSDLLVKPAGLLEFYPEWSELNAFKQKRLFTIDADIVSRPGPRAVDGLEALYRLLHQ